MLGFAKTTAKKLVIDRLRRQDAARRALLPQEFGGLPPALWGCEIDAAGALCVQGLAMAELAARFGSPLYIVNTPWLRKTHDDFIGPFRALYPRAQLATSYKTNPLPYVLRTLHECGTYAEVISEFELWLAGRLGLPGNRIIVNGPGKNRSMMNRAVQMGVKIINIDGLGEIELAADEARKAGRKQPVGVRVTTSVGWSSQFGLSLASGDALTAYERIVKNQWLVPAGVHLHLGTGIKSVEVYLRAIREVLDFTALLRDRLGVTLDTYDLGGGFGVPTVRGIEAWDQRMVALDLPAREAFPPDCPSPSSYAAQIVALFNERRAAGSSPPEIVFEPGRAITSGAQSLLLSVIAVKEGGGRRKLILDGGKNITMPLGWETHKIFPVRSLKAPFTEVSDLYGPLCHPADIVARHLALPQLAIGDAVVIMDAGAYFVPNQMNFSNPRPGAVAVDAGVPRLVRSHERFEDIVRFDELD